MKKFKLKGRDYVNAGQASTQIKQILKKLGIASEIVRRVGIASYESEMNAVMYADEGEMELLVTPEKINITLKDKGQGIENIELAMKEGFSTATNEMRQLGFGAGMGLPNIKKNSDKFKIDSKVGVGTNITVEINLK